MDRSPAIHIGTNFHDTGKHVLQIAGNGDLFDRVLNLAVFDPETRRATRIVSGHGTDTMEVQKVKSLFKKIQMQQLYC